LARHWRHTSGRIGLALIWRWRTTSIGRRPRRVLAGLREDTTPPRPGRFSSRCEAVLGSAAILSRVLKGSRRLLYLGIVVRWLLAIAADQVVGYEYLLEADFLRGAYRIYLNGGSLRWAPDSLSRPSQIHKTSSGCRFPRLYGGGGGWSLPCAAR